MRLTISRPLFALLLLSIVVSIVILLRPSLGVVLVDDLLPTPDVSPAVKMTDVASDETWFRLTAKPPAIKSSASSAKEVTVVPPVISALAVSEPEVPFHGFVYLGRMVRDGAVLAFIGKGDSVDVVAVGEVIGSEWRLDSIGPQGLQLRYLPLDTVRYLAMRPSP